MKTHILRSFALWQKESCNEVGNTVFFFLSVLYQLDIYIEKKDLDNHLMLHMKVSSRVRHNNH